MSLSFYAEKILRRLIVVVIKLLQLPRIFFYLLISSNSIVGRPIRNQPLHTVGCGVVEFSGRVCIGVFPSPFFLSTCAYIEARNRTAKITIGDGTWINNGFTAIAEHCSINIGSRVLIGTNVEIINSDFHGIGIVDRGKSLPEWSAPVVIGDDVFIGSNVRVTKGVTIGAGSIIANSSLVVDNIPSGVIAGGNPARIIKTIV